MAPLPAHALKGGEEGETSYDEGEAKGGPGEGEVDYYDGHAMKSDKLSGLYGDDEGFDKFSKTMMGDEEEVSWTESVPSYAWYLGIALLLVAVWCFFTRDAIVSSWHRRQAARAARAMAGADGELMPVSSWLGTTQPVKVSIEKDGITHKIGASRDGMASVSRVPFVLTEACYESGFPELANMDMVDLLLSKRAELSCVDKDGDERPVDGTMTGADLMAAKSFHVRILPSS